MSVRVSDRNEGKLQVLDLTRRLAAHTIRMCKNEDAFPKRQRWVFTQRIVDEAIECYSCVRRANATLMREGPTLDTDYAYRRSQQVEAHARLNALMSLIDLSFELGNVGDRRASHWMGLAKETNEKLKAWMRSDSKRYVALGASRDGA
ncbi:MAG: hypothetical protein IKF14_18425 [Atopobiaceae bacterium]|nr:hypothetical protein [Atopobiaceae bacterium]MBR3161066.1 hypothetical protein [Atopobiaceae bacterium]